MKKFFRYGLLAFVLFAIGATVVYFYNKTKPKLVKYHTQKAYISSIVKKTVATGSVVPRKEIEIKPQISGIIEKLFVETGQRIKKGELIARIRVIPNISNLNNAETRVNKARISLKNAKTIYDRNKPLFNQNVISQKEFQQFELQVETLQEEYNSAIDNLKIIRDGVSSRGNSNTNTLVKSTVTGTVLDVPVEEGNSVIESNSFNSGTTLALIADMNKMVFEGKVDEAEVGKLNLGMKLILTLGAIENKQIEATLEFISPKGVEDQGAIQFEIRAALEPISDIKIRAGYSANADIVLDARDSVLVIPEVVVQFSNDSAFVEVETGEQIFEKRFVILGLSDGIQIEVLEGISKSDKLKGQQKRDKAPVPSKRKRRG